MEEAQPGTQAVDPLAPRSGGGDDQEAAGSENPPDFRQDLLRMGQVLDHRHQQDGVKPLSPSSSGSSSTLRL